MQPLPDLAPARDEIRFVNREATTVGASVANFANDPDTAIQKLRQSFQIEQNALQALRTTILDRQQAEDKASQSASGANSPAPRPSSNTRTFPRPLAVGRRDEPGDRRLGRLLCQTGRRRAGPVVDRCARRPAASASAAPRAPSITPVPLARYVGVWSYRPGPALNISVRSRKWSMSPCMKTSGHATGTFYARFKLPPGSTGDPVLRFEFSGDFKPTLKQTFKLTTAEGASGTIDLTPGVAFNELEVNFTTDAKPGRFTRAI